MFNGGNGNFLNPRQSANVIRSLDVAINDTLGFTHPRIDLRNAQNVVEYEGEDLE